VDFCDVQSLDETNFVSGSPTQPSQQMVVSRYIPNPLLIYKRKFDLRIYALVTDFDPFPKVYCYKEGLVRFASEEFNLNNFKNKK
jgi:tubulin polyglutamylase TTLL4